MITVETDSLKWLLTLAQRKHTIDGSAHAQLYSVMLKASGGRLSFCSLVKDGVSSLMRLSIPCSGEGEVVITDIDTTLGVLKYHGGALKISKGASHDTVKFKSSNKQTTLSASKEARAFPHTPNTMAQWAEKSNALAEKISIDNLTYTTNDGQKISTCWNFSDLSTTALYEAFRCDSMNGQKFNQYVISFQEPNELEIRVGADLKGKTITTIESQPFTTPVGEDTGFTATYGGGLEHIFQHLNSDIGIHIWDFTEAGMGYPMLISMGDGDYIFQASHLR